MSNSQFLTLYGPWALITGASSGIGKTFAQQLAQRGFNLVLVARRQPLLDSLANELQQAYAIETRVVVADMAELAEVDALIAACHGLDIGLVIPNAGIEFHESFHRQDWAQVYQLLQVNMLAPTRLAHYFAKSMQSRARGGILFVSSVMGFMPTSYFAQYSASKAYIQLLAEGIHQELKAYNIDVTVVAPGLTDTQMGAGITDSIPGVKAVMMSSDVVVSQALAALGQRPSVITGWANKISVLLGSRVFPRWAAPTITGLLRPKR